MLGPPPSLSAVVDGALKWPQMRLSSVLFYLQAELLLVWIALGLFVFWSCLWIIHVIALIYA